MGIVKDQRDNFGDLSHRYLRPYGKRRKFSLETRPKYLPFEIFAYFRSHWIPEVEEQDDPKANEMMQMHFMARSMFNLEQELVVHRFSVLTWELSYCLF